MQRPPRDPAQPLAGMPQLALAMLQGSLVLAACMGVYLFALRAGGASAHDVARTVAVIALTAGNLMLVRVDGARGATLPRLFERGHRAFWVVAALAEVFRFATPPPGWVALAVLAGAGSALAFDLLKPLPRVHAVLAPSARERPASAA
jgi:Ca2+-transporting ATPase